MFDDWHCDIGHAVFCLYQALLGLEDVLREAEEEDQR